MKGVVKGSVFSLILILITVVISAFVNIKFNMPNYVLKGILWVVSGICIFAGVLPVTKSAADKKIIKGVGCSIITVITMLIIVSIASGNLQLNMNFYAYGLICLLCGLLGAIVGINT